MHARYLICCLTAVSLLTPGSRSVVSAQSGPHANHGGGGGPAADAVRQAIERFNDVNAAIAAGYVQFQGCVSGPEKGAMGVHYSNFALFDGITDIANPEVLVYEPKDDRLQLVAAEYVVPAEAWDPSHDPFDKPNSDGAPVSFRPGTESLWPDSVLRTARMGLEEQPKWNLRRLEPRCLVRSLGRRSGVLAGAAGPLEPGAANKIRRVVSAASALVLRNERVLAQRTRARDGASLIAPRGGQRFRSLAVLDPR